MSADSTVMDGLISALLLHGGHVLMLVRAYFDESYGNKSPVLCVAGYLMTDRMARRLDREWSAVLRAHNLPYFRMSACAHGNDPFHEMEKDERILVQTKLIELIKRRTIRGLAVTVDTNEYEKFMVRDSKVGGTYTFCIHAIIGGILRWIELTNYDGQIAYFFEAGHKDQSEANRVMSEMYNDPEMRKRMRCTSYSFVDKVAVTLVQSADLLAWQWFTDKRHEREGRGRRADCASLLDHKHTSAHISAARMLEMRERWALQIDPTLTSAAARHVLGDNLRA